MGIISMSVRFRWLQQSAPSREEKNALTKIANRFNEAIAAGLLPLAASGNNGGVRCLHVLPKLTIATY